jgi:hypothetical protein
MRTMPEVEFVEIELDPDGSPTNRLSEVIGVLKAGKTRIPLFEWNAKGKFFILRHVLHESTVFEFLARRGAANSEEIPLAELLSDPTTRARLDGTLALVPQRAALADAKVVMDANRRIQDVAVTLNGGAEEAFIGWLTNVDVLRHCIAGAGVLDDEG